VQTAGGNYVVIDMGRGRYAFYAHMQPGSLRVKRGDRVKPGDVLGRLGNTGNTDAAHLHFHVMDSPSPLRSNGLPFTFTRMTGLGRITDPATLPTGAPVTIDAAAFSGLRHGQMLLADQVVGFR
jgi:murein DD-endopeptidase MepM/ murein hydrolase activator NlpD